MILASERHAMLSSSFSPGVELAGHGHENKGLVAERGFDPNSVE